MDSTAFATMAGAVSTVAAVLVTGWFGRRQVRAQADRITADITAKAHQQIYAEYGNLIAALRTDAQLAREQSRGALETARDAERRADEAEERAYQAEMRMRALERLLSVLRTFLATVTVPGVDAFLAQMDRLLPADTPAERRRE